MDTVRFCAMAKACSESGKSTKSPLGDGRPAVGAGAAGVALVSACQDKIAIDHDFDSFNTKIFLVHRADPDGLGLT